MTLNFKQQYTLEQRLHKINRIFERYPDRVPIVIEKINEGGLKAVSPAAERSIEKKNIFSKMRSNYLSIFFDT